MASADSFWSIRGAASAEIKVRGSRFIAEAFPVGSEEEAEGVIGRVRKRDYGATHHCTAYRIGADARIFRYNDDGEPSGTAGQPILRQIEARELTNVLVVVTRYYGGTKLGTGGLARAYGDAAAGALGAANFVEHVISERVNVSFSYADTAAAERAIEKFAAEILDANYTDVTTMTLAVPRSRVKAFVESFTNALGGRGRIVEDLG